MASLQLGTGRLALFLIGVLPLGCGQEEKQPALGFDPKFIASEADKGNLVPLKELNAACSREVERTSKRGAACEVQDRVGQLRELPKLRF